MIHLFAGPEVSQINDTQHGKPILVSTTARILFRSANPEYKSQKNDILNKLIADLFAKATVDEQGFKPKSAPNAVGEFRTIGTMRFVAIVDQSSVKIISVKGSVSRLPPVARAMDNIPLRIKKLAGFNEFMCSHLTEFAKKRLSLSDNSFARLEALLLPIYDNNKVKMLKSLCKKENTSDIKSFIAQELFKDNAKALHLENHGLNDALNVKHQL